MLLALTSLLACTSAKDSSEATNPTIEILSPSEGEIVCGTPMGVETRVTGLVLVVPATEGEEAEGEPGTGHIDVMLNGQDVAMAGEESITISTVEDGEYQLKVELSNADHSPVEPYAGDLVYLTVSAASCP